MGRRSIYSENGIKPNTKCICCDETAREINKKSKYAIEEGFYSGKHEGWVCGWCRESDDESTNTVIVYKPQDNQVEKYFVKEYGDDDFGFIDVEDADNLDEAVSNIEVCDCQDSPIHFKYVHTDAWRGYYDPVGEGWKVLHSDCILSGSEDAEELEKFDTDIKKVLWKLGFEFAVAFGRTSNLFSCGYDILIKTEQEQDILKQTALYGSLINLNFKYRDSSRFHMTALTGKSSGFDTNDRLLLEASRRFEAGESFETVSKEILAQAKQAEAKQ